MSKNEFNPAHLSNPKQLEGVNNGWVQKDSLTGKEWVFLGYTPSRKVYDREIFLNFLTELMDLGVKIVQWGVCSHTAEIINQKRHPNTQKSTVLEHLASKRNSLLHDPFLHNTFLHGEGFLVIGVSFEVFLRGADSIKRVCGQSEHFSPLLLREWLLIKESMTPDKRNTEVLSVEPIEFDQPILSSIQHVLNTYGYSGKYQTLSTLVRLDNDALTRHSVVNLIAAPDVLADAMLNLNKGEFGLQDFAPNLKNKGTTKEPDEWLGYRPQFPYSNFPAVAGDFRDERDCTTRLNNREHLLLDLAKIPVGPVLAEIPKGTSFLSKELALQHLCHSEKGSVWILDDATPYSLMLDVLNGRREPIEGVDVLGTLSLQKDLKTEDQLNAALDWLEMLVLSVEPKLGFSKETWKDIIFSLTQDQGSLSLHNFVKELHLRELPEAQVLSLYLERTPYGDLFKNTQRLPVEDLVVFDLSQINKLNPLAKKTLTQSMRTLLYVNWLQDGPEAPSRLIAVKVETLSDEAAFLAQLEKSKGLNGRFILETNSDKRNAHSYNNLLGAHLEFPCPLSEKELGKNIIYGPIYNPLLDELYVAVLDAFSVALLTSTEPPLGWTAMWETRDSTRLSCYFEWLSRQSGKP